MRTYKQLTQEQRYQIYALMRMGHNQTEIAEVVSVHKSTVGRELQRNRGQRGYRPKQAHQLALSRRNKAKRRIQPETWELIEAKLRLDWSPEQISGWLIREEGIRVSHERIYQYILADKQAGGDLYCHLRCQKKRRKRYGGYDRRGQLPHRRSIEERPEIVDQRERLGDWEVDTILGKGRRQAIVTLTERKTRLALIRKVDRPTAQAVQVAIIHLLKPWTSLVHTLTADNGKEFAGHQEISHILEADFFFAHPYAAWERGSNENMNGLLRQYFPKGRDFDTISEEEVEAVIFKLNHRPRKCLAFNSPFQELFKDKIPVALTS
jgi:IS30 family transposase